MKTGFVGAKSIELGTPVIETKQHSYHLLPEAGDERLVELEALKRTGAITHFKRLNDGTGILVSRPRDQGGAAAG